MAANRPVLKLSDITKTGRLNPSPTETEIVRQNTRKARATKIRTTPMDDKHG
jgi:hypothetical protein